MGLPVEINSALIGASSDTGYKISRSLRLRSSASGNLTRTAGSGNQQIYTWSAWVKRGSLTDSSTTTGLMMGYQGASTGQMATDFKFTNTHALQFDVHTNSTAQYILATTAGVFRDTSAWYHIVLAVDTTQTTNSDGVKIYVNGVQQTLTFSNYSQSVSTGINGSGYTQWLGRWWNASNLNGYGDIYLAEINFIDGQQLTPTSFGETDSTTGVWKPKAYTGGSYGTNGYYLKFSDNSSTTTLSNDSSGLGNNWTATNVSLTADVTYDSMLDTPTTYSDGSTGRGNYSVFNVNNKGTNATVTNGSLTASCPASNLACSTFALESGKWYWEVYVTAIGGGASIGIARSDCALTTYLGGTAAGWGYNSNGNVYNNAGSLAAYTSYTTGVLIGVAYDADTGKLYFAHNGTWQGSSDPASGTNPVTTLTTGPIYYAAVSDGTSTAPTLNANFGQQPFSYTPPTGFKALNTQNLTTPVIKNGNQYIEATTWSGDSSSTRSITNNTGIQPDLVWIKARTGTVNNILFDSVRGANIALYPNLTNTDTSSPVNGYLSSFNTNGFTLTRGSSSGIEVNESGYTYVGWQWKKSVTPGLDIVTWTGDGNTGRTVSHSLGAAPKFIITKMRSSSIASWNCWHNVMGTNQVYYTNLTSAAATPGSGLNWNPTSTTISTDPDIGYGTNASGVTYVGYLWAEITGFSKFASYIGNGSSTIGPFVYCGFRPKVVIIKSTSAAQNWNIFDTARSTYNAVTNMLVPNSTVSEYTGGPYIDIYSNGFKIRNTGAQTGAGFNTNNATYSFAAFAEVPFKYALAR